MELGKSSSTHELAFEVCIGVNGWIWVHSKSTTNLILITNAIRNSQVMNDAQVRGMVRDLLSSVQTQTDNN
jgi:exosome complex component RRP40